jgi:xanthine/uracil/vitamin C permease (AzgA family)
MEFKVRSFEFSPRELAGSLGDFGTFLPLAIGYIVVCGLNPAGFLVMMGLTNILLGLIYKLPMPLQPKKAVAICAISQEWTPSMVYSCGFGLGLFWLLLSFTGWIERVIKLIPKCVVRGIQISLGIMLGLHGLSMINWQKVMVEEVGFLVVSILIIIYMRENRYLPAAIILVFLGISIAAIKGDLEGKINLHFSLPPIFIPELREIGETFILAGISQIPLTLTNAVIACSALIRDYFPERAVSEKKLLVNQAVMNLLVPFFGGMPMCHGAGGLASQYYFGARTGGANIMEGLIEIGFGLFLASSISSLFSVFPKPIIGAMLLMVGISLLKFAKDLRGFEEGLPACVTIVASVFTKNMAIGLLGGFIVFHLAKSLKGFFLQRIERTTH